MSAGNDPEKDATPILLHPAKRAAAFEQGRTLFNEERFYEAHERWEELWRAESGREREFVQGLILAAAHLHHVEKGNWSGARRTASAALEKLSGAAPARQPYGALDADALRSALAYNTQLLISRERSTDLPPPLADAFIHPKLMET